VGSTILTLEVSCAGYEVDSTALLLVCGSAPALVTVSLTPTPVMVTDGALTLPAGSAVILGVCIVVVAGSSGLEGPAAAVICERALGGSKKTFASLTLKVQKPPPPSSVTRFTDRRSAGTISAGA